METLSEAEKLIVTLIYFEEASIEDAAESLGVSVEKAELLRSGAIAKITGT